MLAAKRKSLVKKGLGNKPNATRELTQDEIKKLFETKFFSFENPVALQRALWWFISLHFGFRARDEARKLCWGDVGLEFDDSKQKNFLVWYCERGTKTRNGDENQEQRMYNPRIYETGNNNCPVKYYNIFKESRPSDSFTSDSPFFLAINHKRKLNIRKSPWYLNKPLGKNKIGEFMSDAAKVCNFSGKKVANHSVRKTSIGKLLDANIQDIYVAQHSGHKNTDSLKHYKSANNEKIYEMSNILSTEIISSSSLTEVEEVSSSLTSKSFSSGKSSSTITTSSSKGSSNSRSLFDGAVFSGNCTVNIYYNGQYER